jgi:hypothetical protein
VISARPYIDSGHCYPYLIAIIRTLGAIIRTLIAIIRTLIAIIRTLIAMIRRPVCQLPSAPRQTTGSRAAQKRVVSDRSLEQCEAAALARAEAEGWGGFPEEDETLARLLAEELAARAPRRMSGQQNIKARDEVTMARAFPRSAVHLCACVYARAMVLPHLH